MLHSAVCGVVISILGWEGITEPSPTEDPYHLKPQTAAIANTYLVFGKCRFMCSAR